MNLIGFVLRFPSSFFIFNILQKILFISFVNRLGLYRYEFALCNTCYTILRLIEKIIVFASSCTLRTCLFKCSSILTCVIRKKYSCVWTSARFVQSLLQYLCVIQRRVEINWIESRETFHTTCSTLAEKYKKNVNVQCSGISIQMKTDQNLIKKIIRVQVNWHFGCIELQLLEQKNWKWRVLASFNYLACSRVKIIFLHKFQLI